MNKWDEVFSDVEFAKSLIAMEPADVQKTLASKGYDFTMEEIMEAGEEINKMIKAAQNGELDAESLDAVSGGALGWNFKTGFIVGVVGVAIVCGW